MWYMFFIILLGLMTNSTKLTLAILGEVFYTTPSFCILILPYSNDCTIVNNAKRHLAIIFPIESVIVKGIAAYIMRNNIKFTVRFSQTKVKAGAIGVIHFITD